jgi:hypothetical protein
MRGNPTRNFTSEAVVSILFALLYLAIPTKMFYIDGIYYAEHLENMPYYDQGFHPHHLIYLPLMHLLYGAFHLIIPSVRALAFLQALNAVLGGLTIWFFSRILRKLNFSIISRVLAIILLGSSYTFWHHASDANIYILVHLLVLCVALIVLSDRFYASKSCQYSTGFLLGFTCLVHQIAVLMIIPLGLYIWSRDKKNGSKILLRLAIPFLLAGFIAYPVVFNLFSGETNLTLTTFLLWAGSFGRAEHYFAFNASYANDMFQTITRGHYNAFFTLKPLERILFDGTSGDTAVSIRLYIYFMFLTSLTVISFIFQSISHVDSNKRKIYFFFLIQFIVYFTLTSIFMPENHFYRIFYLCPLIVIWTGMFSMLGESYKLILKPIVAIAILVFLYLNLTKGIIPQSRIRYNPYLTMTAQLDQVMTERDVVLFPLKDRYFTGIYRYFGKGDAIHLQQGEHFLNRDELARNFEKYKSETLSMLDDRYDRIFLTQDAFNWLGLDRKLKSRRIDPVVFTPKNYRRPHPDFMAVRLNDFEFVRWIAIYDENFKMNRYYAEVRIRQTQAP